MGSAIQIHRTGISFQQRPLLRANKIVPKNMSLVTGFTVVALQLGQISGRLDGFEVCS